MTLPTLTTGWKRIWISVSVVWILGVVIFASKNYDWTSAQGIKRAFNIYLLGLTEGDLEALGCIERNDVMLAALLSPIDPTIDAPPADRFDAQWKALYSLGNVGMGEHDSVSPTGALVTNHQWMHKLLPQISCSPRIPTADEFSARLSRSIEDAGKRFAASYAQSISHPRNYLILSAFGFCVPFVFLLGGLCIAWIRAGFREPPGK